MNLIVDLHIHSHFSIATSKKLTPEYLDYWAKIKGMGLFINYLIIKKELLEKVSL